MHRRVEVMSVSVHFYPGVKGFCSTNWLQRESMCVSGILPQIFPLQITSKIKGVIKKKKKSHKKIYWPVLVELRFSAFVRAAATFWFILDAGKASVAAA